MNYFEQAQIKLTAWINSDPARVNDWSVFAHNRTVAQYCALFAYQQNVIDRVVEEMYKLEAQRVIKSMYAGLTSAK